MHKKKLQVETAGILETIDPVSGGIAGGVMDPRAKTIGDKAMKSAANVAGGLGGMAIGTGLGTAVAGPFGGVIGGAAGKWMGSDALRGVVGNTDENKMTASDLNEVTPEVVQDPKAVCEEFLNKHSSSAEAAEEFNDTPAHVLPSTNENKGKLVTSTACSEKC